MVHKADGPEAITVGERQVRRPRDGEILLRVRAAAVSPAAVVLWRTLGGGPVQPQFTADMDAAGVAEAVGPGVDHIKDGQPQPAQCRAGPGGRSCPTRGGRSTGLTDWPLIYMLQSWPDRRARTRGTR